MFFLTNTICMEFVLPHIDSPYAILISFKKIICRYSNIGRGRTMVHNIVVVDSVK